MTDNTNNPAITVLLSGRIDSANAAQTEADIQAQLAGKGDCPITLDASRLEYISSAGLRVILRLKKACPEANMLEGLTIRGSHQIERRLGTGVTSHHTEDDVVEWLNKLFKEDAK